MIVLTYVLLLALVLTVSYNKFHRILNITSIFSGIWFLFGALSCFGFYGVRIPGIRVHIYVWIFVLIVDVIFWIFATNKSITIESKRDEAIKFSSRAKKVQIVALVLIIPLLLKVVNLFVSAGSLAAVREMFFSGTYFETMYQDLIFRIVPMGLLNALIIYYTFYSFETRKYKFLIYALLNAVFVTLINGGRYTLILLLYSILILWITRQISVFNSSNAIKYKKKIKRIGIIVVLIMAAVTLSRGQEILENILIYFSGSLSYLDYIINNPTQFALDQPLYGYLTFAAIVEPVVLGLKVLGLTTAKVPSYEFNIYCQRYYDIGNGSTHILFNANTSIIYYFLRDFGSIGVVIGALVLGFLAVKAYNKWQQGNRFWGLVFLYLGSVMFNSLMTYQLIGPIPLFIILTFYFCTQKRLVIRIK